MDDLLDSVKTVQEAATLIDNVTRICAADGFNLTNSTINTKEVIMAIPKAKRCKGSQNQDLVPGVNPQEKALGIDCNINREKLELQVILLEKPLMRRGLFSMLSSVYDPLRPDGLLILDGWSVIKSLCKNNFSWDEIIPQNIERQWVKWVNSVSINIPRCYETQKFGDIKICSFHKFPNTREK